ncbi:MAG: riboflavin biosynthesis protein RibD, partial [Gammaproteobacteria bacterium]|nr:riboflavin biosynthesis protein RibD [Gammaproteobacteria bacterium]
HADRLRLVGAELRQLPGGNGGVALDALLALLGELQVNDVLVEAGPTLSGALIAAGLVDELITYVAPRLLGDAAHGSVSLAPARLDDTPWLTITDIRRVGEDIRITAEPRAAQP